MEKEKGGNVWQKNERPKLAMMKLANVWRIQVKEKRGENVHRTEKGIYCSIRNLEDKEIKKLKQM